MNVVNIIPARMGSSRFPGKPLASILDKSMIEHCYRRAYMAESNNITYVATCDKEIFNHVREFGGNVVMTSSSHDRATTRTSEALEHIEKIHGTEYDIVLMVQGDEPLVSPKSISFMLQSFLDETVDIVNLMSPILDKIQFIDNNNVKVVCNKFGNAMYFSREPIPHNWTREDDIPMFMQTGIIAFKRDILIDFNKMPETSLERIESIDMNRVLEAGMNVRMIASEKTTLSVDTPAELEDAIRMMRSDIFFESYRNIK
tara:strand:- start:2959 stop:3732 length:774 start_codon:yes stop_codon:yes gene_type:complete